MSEKKRVDDEWKQRAEEEKRKIEESMGGGRLTSSGGAPEGGHEDAREHEREAVDTGEAAPGRIDFLTLLSQIASQAMASLGQLEDPRTGQRHVDLQLARDSIDILSMLEEKTQGNLSHEEDATLGELLQTLRFAYSSMVRAAQQQAMDSSPFGNSTAPSP